METSKPEPQTRIACELRPIEANDSRFGGAHLLTPSGIELAALWREAGLIGDTLATAKRCAAHLLDKLQRDYAGRDVDRINWPSVVAAIQSLANRWNDARRAALYAERSRIALRSSDAVNDGDQMGPGSLMGGAGEGEGALH
jgi:hypothetical protein